MPTVVTARPAKEPVASLSPLGPRGPFPSLAMKRALERRWLHYAFLDVGGELALVSNTSWLGPPAEHIDLGERLTSILLIYRRGRGWSASQFNTETLMPLWSAFRQPHLPGEPDDFMLRATAGSPAVHLRLRRSSRPCTSQCAPFAGDQHLRWQSETGILTRGAWRFRDEEHHDVVAIGYHERVRGYWGWPELGGWVFGFANDPSRGETGPPPTAVVFTLIQPLSAGGATTASVMLWRAGRLRRHFPRRRISVAVRGELDRDHVVQVPWLSQLLGVPPMCPIPERLLIVARLGMDEVVIDFECLSAARVVVPCETGIRPFSVHEVIGRCCVEVRLRGCCVDFETHGIVEFAGGAGDD